MDINIYVAMVSSSSGSSIKNVNTITLSSKLTADNIPKINDIHTLTYFSSIGPTVDGRLKPDILGPGNRVISARSHGTQYNDSVCGTQDISILQG